MIALLLAGCSSGGVREFTVQVEPPTGTVPGAATCKADKSCELVGTMTIEKRAANRSWAALRQDGTACIPLLLSEAVYERNWRRWDGKRVRVRGTALNRGPGDTGNPDYFIDLIQYRDRWLSPDQCSESTLALYVDELTLARGR